jgi:predicted N-formylglutamate amidohydrolase
VCRETQVHSFTPVFKTVARVWHVGVLYNRDPRFAQILMELLHREDGLVVGDNEPYSVTDASDHTIPVHGEQRNLPIELGCDAIVIGLEYLSSARELVTFA